MWKHNGYINVESSEKGTVFELYFPVTREEVATVEIKVNFIKSVSEGTGIIRTSTHVNKGHAKNIKPKFKSFLGS